MVRYGMVIDLKRCVGCDTCTIACRVENLTPPGILWCDIRKFERGKYPNARLVSVPVNCYHCDNPPCVKVCPTGASYKREDGIVLIDYEKCIGCQACILSCPYRARSFVYDVGEYYKGKGLTPFEKLRGGLEGTKSHIRSITEKCTFCVERVAAGKQPFCVETCVGDARFFGDLDDPKSKVSELVAKKVAFQLRPELRTDPCVYYIPP
jgi:molybdopterin-containing oxidoreductase family iron-sulfur binding subunit